MSDLSHISRSCGSSGLLGSGAFMRIKKWLTSFIVTGVVTASPSGAKCGERIERVALLPDVLLPAGTGFQAAAAVDMQPEITITPTTTLTLSPEQDGSAVL